MSKNLMSDSNNFDILIIGGSYSGLAAGMALGRALKKVLIVDDVRPCNRQTPFSHNFITHDGKKPKEIAELAKEQVLQYKTIDFFDGQVADAVKTKDGFQVRVTSGEIFLAKKLIFATGIKDILPTIEGIDACWGISAIHCPYCHGYEVRNEITGILANGEQAYDFSRLISNWTRNLTLFTHGRSTLTDEQITSLLKHNIQVVEKEIERLIHSDGYLEKIIFRDATEIQLTALYVSAGFEQQCNVPQALGCGLTSDGFIEVGSFQETTVQGVYACGDNTTKMRTVANAVAMGTTAGISASKKMILEEF
jgi:thioredoxin reductase